MLKVVIADDEERICQLIKALIDWEAMGMQIAGIGHNGLEAKELVELHRPEILITDIRMPGCNGLELIEAVKTTVPECEIIIISGYAHFEYAQSAIKFGVGDYLLKPVNQSELYATLEKLKDRILERAESENDRQQLMQKSENDMLRLQANLMEQLMEDRAGLLSLERLREDYYLQVKEGIFQALAIRVDEKGEGLSESGRSIIMDRIESLLTGILGAKCWEILVCKQGNLCVGLLNYEKSRTDEIRRLLKECLNQLEAQKNLYGPVTFSCAVGSGTLSPEKIQESVKEALLIIKERLIKGTGRVLDKMPQETNLQERKLLEKYTRQMTQAIEVLSVEEADLAVEQIRESIGEMKNVSGYEVLELIIDCGRLFLSQMELGQREQEMKEFRERCDRCGEMKDLLDCLVQLQRKHLEKLVKQHENDTIRPIRLAKQYIQNHFGEQITMEEVCNNVGLSVAYFSVLFKKTEGEGFAKYLINIRVEEAKRMLRESNESVAEICRKVGYNDLKHFTHTFEKVTGVKPATYRKLYG